MQLQRNIKLPPHMQQAYLQSMSRSRGAGYVNPQLQAAPVLEAGIASEGNRFDSMERFAAGRDQMDRRMDFTQRQHDDQMRYRQHQLGLARRELKYSKRGDTLANLLGVARLGLGYMDDRKTRAETREIKNTTKANYEYMLNHLRTNNPQQYIELISQPHVREQIAKLGITLDYPGPIY